jgi:hypothetical protein
MLKFSIASIIFNLNEHKNATLRKMYRNAHVRNMPKIVPKAL